MVLLNVNFFQAMTQYYVQGGSVVGMSIITIFFVAMLFAAWKAPNWVEELGQAALVAGILWFLIGANQAFADINEVGYISNISKTAFFIWLKIQSTLIMHGVAVYIISLIIRSVQKFRS